MAQFAMIEHIRQWMVDQSLQDVEITQLFEQLCIKIRAAGIPICRARLFWPTLHPLYSSENVQWDINQPVRLEQFIHQDKSTPLWESSPLKYVVENNLQEFRRELDGVNQCIDFEVLEEFKSRGMTDYLILFTPIANMATERQTHGVKKGILISWATDRKGGFSTDDLRSLQSIQGRLSVTCNSVIQNRIGCNIVNAYLGKRAGNHVMQGQIRRGDGVSTDAILWYSDMRNSTHLSESMPPEDYLELLNSYFEAVAGPVVREGGEVLDFIGDAVLGIFPYENDEELAQAAQATCRAIRESQALATQYNEERKAKGLVGFEYGIGIHVGQFMFGNIGIAQRLSFSVIGTAVNQVVRIESMTKEVGKPVLVSAKFAELCPECCDSQGIKKLKGIEKEHELFTFRI